MELKGFRVKFLSAKDIKDFYLTSHPEYDDTTYDLGEEEWNELKSIQNISNDETIVRNKVDIYRMARFFIEVHKGSSFFFDEVRFIVGTRGGT